jgi:hypothetical protein
MQGPEELSSKRVHPAQLAHAARIARAQQVGITLYGFKVFPDLTPGKAFMWGSIVAVYVVGLASFSIARSVGITSVHPLARTAVIRLPIVAFVRLNRCHKDRSNMFSSCIFFWASYHRTKRCPSSLSPHTLPPLWARRVPFLVTAFVTGDVSTKMCCFADG